MYFAHSTTMAEDDISALKEALCNQLQITQRLNTELEDERAASASGADEALTMILRLQKEKSEEKMEAYQYKQMAESKLRHAEESLAYFEQLVFQKDIEIESLKHKVQKCGEILQNVRQNENFRFTSSALLHRTNSCIQIKSQTSEITLSHEDSSLLPEIESIWRGIGEKASFDLKHEQDSIASSWLSALSTSCIESETLRLEIPNSNNGFFMGKPSKKVLQEPMVRIPESNDSTPRKGTSTSYQSIFLLENDIGELKYQVQKLANDVRIMKQDDVLKGKEQIKLLRTIKEQLKSIQSHIRCSKSTKFSPQDEAMFVSLTEAMLSFSI